MFRLAIFGACVAVVTCHDVFVGKNQTGMKIFDENKQASPALWKQVENVTISANDSDVISCIFVTDLRPEKDGDVRIVDGGEGQKNVTLELKSPTLLRGFDFHIEVYATSDDQVKKVPTHKDEMPPHPSQTRLRRKPEDFHMNNDAKLSPPVTTFKDTAKTDFGYKAVHSMSSDTTVNDDNKKNINIHAEHVSDDKLKTNNPAKAAAETKSDNLNNTENKTLKQEGTGTVDSLRHVRKADDEVDEDELAVLSINQQHQVKGIKNLPASQHPIVTVKPEAKGTSTTKGIHIDNPTTKTADAKETDVKREARDAHTNKDSNNMKPTTINVNNNEHVTGAPSTTTLKYNSKGSDEFKRQEIPVKESNEDISEMNNTRAFMPSIGFGITETSTLPGKQVKERAVRNTQAKVPVNLPSIIKNEDKNNVSEHTTLPDHKHSHDSKDFKTDDEKITLDNQTQNAHGFMNTQSSTEHERLNTAAPGSFYRPLPYAASSTTEKSQNKRDTEPKSTENKKQNSDKDLMEEAPLVIHPSQEKSTQSVRKPVISIQ